jgi:hypothetical protein
MLLGLTLVSAPATGLPDKKPKPVKKLWEH